MKEIQPVIIWVNGNNLTAIWFQLHINYDNLIDTAVFYYALKDQDFNIVTQGNITMSGADYLAWNGSNDYAWNWAAKTLNLTLV
jgi:hypothetical protein